MIIKQNTSNFLILPIFRVEILVNFIFPGLSTIFTLGFTNNVRIFRHSNAATAICVTVSSLEKSDVH